ncbi:PRELI-like family-domain-containing protein, partial [Zopfochytrium polystomum]
LFEKVEYIDCPWQTLTAANWRKYPNDISTHVLSVDVLDRRIDPTTGALHTERLLCCKQAAPAFLRAVGLPIPEIAYFHEVSVLDPEKKEFTAVSVNLTMKSVMAVRETCIYRERRRPRRHLRFVQRAEFSASFGIAAVAQMMEDAAAARFAANAKNGLRALESVIRRVVEEGEEVAAAAAAAATADGGEGEGAARAAE